MNLNIQLNINSNKLPEWANWLAIDGNGSLWVYEIEPTLNQEGTIYPDNSWHLSSKFGKLDCLADPLNDSFSINNWHETKTKIK